jgi:anti-sigma factor RsiW
MSAHPDIELSAYLDGELAGEELARVEAHLASCEECRASLEDLRTLVGRARALDDRPPARDLWPGIASRLAEATPGADVIPLAPRRRRIAFSIPQLLAASVALVAVSATIAVMMTRGDTAPPVATGAGSQGTMLPPAAVLPVQQAVTTYDRAIRDLELVLATRRQHLDTATVRVLEQSLQLIDLAIEQAREALANDPNNVYLNGHLERTLGRKLELLRRAATLPVS